MEVQMIVRVIEFLNNFYRDDGCEEETLTNVQYCTLGYFDGIRTEQLGKFLDNKANEEYKEMIQDKLYAYIVNNLDGKNSERNVICFIDDEDKDNKFWNENKSAILFVSLVRLKNVTQESFEELRNKICKFNEEKDQIVYYSTDHCEIVVITKTSDYSSGIECIKNIHEKFQVFKMYSLLAIDEEMLSSEIELENRINAQERINCRFHISVNWNLIKESEDGNNTDEKFKKSLMLFFENLKDKLRLSKEHKFMMCNKMGNSDIIVQINDVLLVDLLKCYKKGNPLRHSSEVYYKRWFNIESELFLKEEEIKFG